MPNIDVFMQNLILKFFVLSWRMEVQMKIDIILLFRDF